MMGKIEETAFSKNLHKPTREIMDQDFRDDVSFNGEMFYTEEAWRKEKRAADTMKY